MIQIRKIQAFSLSMYDQHLMSPDGLIEQGQDIVVKVPLGGANPVNGGPIVGEHYMIRYQDDAGMYHSNPGLRYVGILNQQLIFTTASS